MAWTWTGSSRGTGSEEVYPRTDSASQGFYGVCARGLRRRLKQTGGPRLLLTAAVYGEVEPSRTYYQIPHIARWVDYANLMAYDFHGQWDLASGARHHAALFPEVHDSVQGWLQEGFPAEKLVLGTAAFARTFSLATRPRGTGVGQRAVSIGVPGNFSDTEGLLTYQEICHLLKSGQWQRVWLEEQQAPVAFGNVSGGRWVWAGYDDQESLMAKTNYIRQNELAGVMLWSMTDDDFNNHCGDGAWPLMSVLQQQLPDNRSPSKTSHVTDTSSICLHHNHHDNHDCLAVTIPYDTTRWTAPDRARADRTLPTEHTHQTSEVVRPTTPAAAAVAPEGEDGYRQCRVSDTFGPALQCSSHHGKPGFRRKVYLYCFEGFFAVECSCLSGFFYNRCIRSCDTDNNFLACPFSY
ncbi:LOW QUALITY PROTEIN: chitinase-3-like protein 1 [Pomacea canaliculata]|uniref:LOW QUALITY PROTEIN: chitinase-3-like protein 1 n=1 Tax=Pomacea canaliculata TaxID=400727 RepID=UPI000D7325BC|nr:LOW QUALITY PROTEIN: chitinase-3-like protein 1 [Pomacea canaliculata]